MSEAELTALTQQTVGLAYIFVGAVGLWLYLMHVGDDGLRRWERLRDHFTVKRSGVEAPIPRADYVAQPARPPSVSPMSALDTDTDTDTDTPADIAANHNAQGETVYRVTAEQLQRVREDERLAGIGRALGTLKGLGLLREVERAQRLTEVKNALVGTSREKQKRLNRLIDATAAEVEPAEERELLAIKDEGGPRLVER
jgi:hypothetical protein